MKFSQALKEIRLRKKMSATEFARTLGVSRMTLYALENDLRPPSKNVINALNDRLKIPYEHIVMFSMTRKDIEVVKREMFKETKEQILKRIEQLDVNPAVSV